MDKGKCISSNVVPGLRQNVNSGIHFELVIDHHPFIPIFNNNTLDAVENPRLQQFKEKLSPYQFSATWRAGKL